MACHSMLLKKDAPMLMLSATLKNGYIDCMNLVLLLMVDIPEQEAVPGAHFDIEYLSNGVERLGWKSINRNLGKYILWRRFMVRYYSAIDYVEYGVISPHDGWIEIEDTTTTTATTPLYQNR